MSSHKSEHGFQNIDTMFYDLICLNYVDILTRINDNNIETISTYQYLLYCDIVLS